MGFLVLFAASVLAIPAHAIEPWADAKFPTDLEPYLEIWLDASAQKAGRAARKLSSADNAEIEVWLDASGNHNDARQPILNARPRLVMSAGGAFVRFDGKDDFLRAAPGIYKQGMTVFIVAAPRQNPGGFRGFFAMNSRGENDYKTGLNLDLGSNASATLSWINGEGTGTDGQRNLLDTQFDFGTFHIFALTATGDSLKLRADGIEQRTRPRRLGDIVMDELTIGARSYSNEGRAAHAQGFLEADIAELIVIRRSLSDDARI